MEPAVRFEHISKKYRLGTGHSSLRDLLARPFDKLRGQVPETQVLWALKDVNFEIPNGSALGLIGPNGSGKTTTLKVLSKITQPTVGRVKVNGRISALIELGAGFHQDLTGRENIYLNATILGMPRRDIDRAFDKIVAFSGLERFIDTPVKRYSSGMYVRLGFSVAAHVEPDVLLVDEVLAVGDAQFRQKCARRIEELQEIGTTIVFVAHNLYLVKSVCEKAIFLLDGEVQAHGDVDRVIGSYESWLHSRPADVRAKVDDRVRMGQSDEIKITRVEVVNLNKHGTGDFAYNDPVEIQVHYDARRPIRSPKLVLRIRRADGTTACMIRTGDYKLKLDEVFGTGMISLVIDPLQLAGGGYMVTASLFGPIDGVPFAWADSKWFQASGISFGLDETSGVFVPKVTAAQVIHEEPSLATAVSETSPSP